MGLTELPDEAIEAFFLGDAHDAWERDEALRSLVDHVLRGATGPAPRPSPALLAFMGKPSAAAAAPRTATPLLAATPPWQPRSVAAGATPTDLANNVVPLFRRLRLTVGIAAAAGVAAAALAVVGTSGVLPEPVMRTVSWVVEAVTPFEMHAPAVSGGDHAPQQGPTSTVRVGPSGPVVGPGPFGPVVGAGPAGQGGAPRPQAVSPPGQGEAPGRPAISTPGQGGAPGPPAVSTPTPPASIPAGVLGAVRPRGTSVDPGPPTSAGPPTPSVPGPGVSPTGGGSGTPSTTPATSVDRARQAPGDGTVPSTIGGPSARRP